MKRKIMSAALTLVMLLSISASAVGVMPLWDDRRVCEAKLAFSGNTANCVLIVEGEPGAKRIVTQMTLQKQDTDGSYDDIVIWGSRTTFSSTVTRTETENNCTPGNYRLVCKVTVYDADGVGETITVEATAKN